jgi:hypothetical protein
MLVLAWPRVYLYGVLILVNAISPSFTKGVRNMTWQASRQPTLWNC